MSQDMVRVQHWGI